MAFEFASVLTSPAIVMGLFDRFRFGSRSKAASPKSVDPSSLITVHDKFGRRYEIPKTEWRTKILPGVLKDANDDADSLYQVIVICLDDGLYEDVLDASQRLMAIDADRERSHTVRAIVLMKTGRLDEAEKILAGYLRDFGASGIVLTNLAKIYAERGDHPTAEATLWQAIQQDPNQSNGLLWWATLERERKGESAYWDAMLKAAELPGSWRPQLWLARRCLEQKNLEQAMRLYDHVLSKAIDQPEVLMMVSGDLGNSGHASEMLKLVLPMFDPQRHDFRAGLNLLEGCLTTKNSDEGERLLHRLFALERPDLKEHLLRYSTEFDKLRQPVASLPYSMNAPVEVVVLPLDRPIWSYGLRDPQWLWSQVSRREDQVVFLSLANTSRSNLKDPTVQAENDLGRLTRAIPLYLGEAVFFWTEFKARTVIPIVRGGGPVVSGAEWPEDQIFAYADGATFIVTGSAAQSGSRLDMRLSLWNGRERTFISSIAKSASVDQIGTIVLGFETELLKILAGAGTFKAPQEVWYRRPTQTELNPYLNGLGQSLSMSIVHNGIMDKSTLWGERNMLEWFLSLVLQMPNAQVPRIMLLSALAKAQEYGSEAYTEFKTQILQLLTDERDPNSPFYRLSPLLFRVFGMNEEFRRRAAELARNAEPNYRTWIDLLTSKGV